ncbi:MAG: hypothetical protein E4G92_01490, partial [Bacteroidia bacterium]
MVTIITERVILDGGSRVAHQIPYDNRFINLVRKLPDATWSRKMHYWHIADIDDIDDKIVNVFIDIANIEFRGRQSRKLIEKVRDIRQNKELKSHFIPKPSESVSIESVSNGNLVNGLSLRASEDIDKYRSWLESHRYPLTTVRTYTSMMAVFLKFVAPREANECDANDLTRMVHEYILPKGLSYSFQNQLISAVKKFYGEIYKQVIDPGEFTRPRTQHRLPNVLSKEEVKRVLGAPVNEKHRVILSVIYGCGLRRSEVIMLELQDLDRDRMLLSVRQSKGYKDRVVPVSPKLVEMIDSYMIRYRPKVYLFEGQYPGRRYSAGSVEKVFRMASEKAGIKKNITLHGLRHSYAT